MRKLTRRGLQSFDSFRSIKDIKPQEQISCCDYDTENLDNFNVTSNEMSVNTCISRIVSLITLLSSLAIGKYFKHCLESACMNDAQSATRNSVVQCIKSRL